MNKGTVKWFNNSKGYGFLVSEDGTEFFVHYSGINTTEKFKSLAEDENVVFDVVDTEKGRQAINVTVVVETSKEDFEKMMDTINSSAQKVLNGEA